MHPKSDHGTLPEAIRTLGLPARVVVKKLKENPDLVRQLSHYKVATERIPSFNVNRECGVYRYLLALFT